MLILDHWADMTFHLKDIITLFVIVLPIAGTFFTIRSTVISNKRRIAKCEENIDYLLKKKNKK